MALAMKEPSVNLVSLEYFTCLSDVHSYC